MRKWTRQTNTFSKQRPSVLDRANCHRKLETVLVPSELWRELQYYAPALYPTGSAPESYDFGSGGAFFDDIMAKFSSSGVNFGSVQFSFYLQ